MGDRPHAAIRPVICPQCPFHRGGCGHRLGANLRSERRRDIADAVASGESFPCHMEANGETETGPAGQRQCTGCATVLDREGNPNLIMQLAERLGEPPYTPAETVPWATMDEWANQKESNQ